MLGWLSFFLFVFYLLGESKLSIHCWSHSLVDTSRVNSFRGRKNSVFSNQYVVQSCQSFFIQWCFLRFSYAIRYLNCTRAYNLFEFNHYEVSVTCTNGQWFIVSYDSANKPEHYKKPLPWASYVQPAAQSKLLCGPV